VAVILVDGISVIRIIRGRSIRRIVIVIIIITITTTTTR